MKIDVNGLKTYLEDKDVFCIGASIWHSDRKHEDSGYIFGDITIQKNKDIEIKITGSKRFLKRVKIIKEEKNV